MEALIIPWLHAFGYKKSVAWITSLCLAVFSGLVSFWMIATTFAASFLGASPETGGIFFPTILANLLSQAANSNNVAMAFLGLGLWFAYWTILVCIPLHIAVFLLLEIIKAIGSSTRSLRG